MFKGIVRAHCPDSTLNLTRLETSLEWPGTSSVECFSLHFKWGVRIQADFFPTELLGDRPRRSQQACLGSATQQAVHACIPTHTGGRRNSGRQKKVNPPP